ncbi:vomeronasal type-1 receptor 2-like [Ctenodactylus gundi]
MASVDLQFGILVLFQIVIGTLGNFSLLCHYAFLYYSKCRPRSTDLVRRHLTVANFLVILSRGIPQTMAALGFEDFLKDLGCKLVFYVHRVGRGVSMSTTSLLSVFQAIIICPRNSRWAEHRMRALKCIGPSTVLCWVLHMLLNVRVPLIMLGRWSNRSITKVIDFQYCSAMVPGKVIASVSTTLTYFHDILCLELMVWASGSMVFNLYRHKQRVYHIHRHRISSSSSSPEARATQSILVLMCAFLSFYTLSFIIYGLLSLCDKNIWWLVNASPLINSCFPTVSPFILMSHERGVLRLIWKK